MVKSVTDPFRELKSRLAYLIFALVIYRIGVHIPVPGVDLLQVKKIFEQGEGSIFQLFNMFSGGALSNASLLALGVAPYISASIIMQLLSHMYAPLKELRTQGSSGQKRITYYTRYLTLALAIVQGFAITKAVMSQGMALHSGSSFLFIGTVSLTTGALFMMWLGEQITEKGIGNGISMLIFSGIAAKMPTALGMLISQTKQNDQYGQFFAILLIIVGLFLLIVVVERAQRQIAIHYAKRQNFGARGAIGERSHLPLKINMAGVIPAIFASAIITFLISVLSVFNGSTSSIGRYISDFANAFRPGNWLYIATFTLLIVLFSFFYTAMMFENRELAENLKKSNAFIQGFRPGKQTADYLDLVQERLTLVGAVYVAFVCVLPSIMDLGSTNGQILFLFGGTSMLIAVVVAMDFVAQIQSHLVSKKYESMTKKANLFGYTR